MYCWPSAWLEAAVSAGLAYQCEDGVSWQIVGGEEMRAKLTKFAEAIADYAIGNVLDDMKHHEDRG